MVKDVLQQRHVVVAASWSSFEVLIHQDQITQSTFLAPDPFSSTFSRLFPVELCKRVGSRTFDRAGPFAAARSEKRRLVPAKSSPRRRHVSASSDSQIRFAPLTILMNATSVPNSIGCIPCVPSLCPLCPSPPVNKMLCPRFCQPTVTRQ